MRFVSLFSGIGGLDLGLETAGWECVAQVEIEPFARRVLAKHWPAVPRWADVRKIGGSDFPACDAIVGGFPCQDISCAGRGDGLSGERSGLWFEYLRLVQEVRPRWVLAENVPALRTRGIDTVLGGLEQEGYACWPVVVGARHVGAPHRRDRVFIVARLADADSSRRGEQRRAVAARTQQPAAERIGSMADADRAGLRAERSGGLLNGERLSLGHDAHRRHRWPSRPGEPQHGWEEPRTTEPPLGGAVDGLPAGLVRRESRLRRASLKTYGNAVVPQVAEVIGRAILSLDQSAAGRHAGTEGAANQADAQLAEFAAAGKHDCQTGAQLSDKDQEPLPVDVFPVHFAPPNTRSMRSRKDM